MMTITAQRTGNRRIAIGASLVILAVIVITSLRGMDPLWVAESTAALRRNGADPEFMTDGSVGTILLRNGAVALFLFSGVISAGTSPLIGLTLTGLSSGITLALVVDASGWAGLIADVIWYAPLELGGFVCVAAAGLLPLVTALRGNAVHDGVRIPRPSAPSTPHSGAESTDPPILGHNHTTALGLYLSALPSALQLGAVGAVAIGLGAVVEAIVIALP